MIFLAPNVLSMPRGLPDGQCCVRGSSEPKVGEPCSFWAHRSRPTGVCCECLFRYIAG